MTTQSDNTLEGILKKFAIDTHEVRPGQDETLNFDNAKAALTKWRDDAIAAHTNAEIAKVLERLESELNEQKKAAETNLAYHVDVTKNERLIRDWQGTVHGIEFCRPAIAAERAKLKGVK